MNKIIKLAIVEDDAIYRRILGNYLQQFNDFKIIIECSNGKEFIDALQKQTPDVVLLDLGMPVMNGTETTEYLSEYYPQIKKIILTVHNEENIFLDLIKKGANWFLQKDDGINQVADAIYSVCKHQYYFAGWELRNIVTAKDGKKDAAFLNEMKFTDKELEVIKLLCGGNTNYDISEKLFMSKRTVEGYRSRIFKKANVFSLAGLVIYAMRCGLINLNDGKD